MPFGTVPILPYVPNRIATVPNFPSVLLAMPDGNAYHKVECALRAVEEVRVDSDDSTKHN